MAVELACKVSGCKGKIDWNLGTVEKGLVFFPCSECGRLYTKNSNMVYDDRGKALFRRDDGTTIADAEITLEKGRRYKNSRQLYVRLEALTVGDMEDDDPEWVDIGPETPLIYDGEMDEDFRFHDECGIRYLLDWGDVLGFEKFMPIEFVTGKTYRTMRHTHVCLEGMNGDCDFADMVELPQDTMIVFDELVSGMYRFHGEDGTRYHLYNDDVENLEEVK